MPGHDSSEGVDLRGLAAKILGSQIKDVAQGVASALLPDCYCCSTKAIPLRCTRCGQYACADHGYFNVKRLEGLCRRCLVDLLKEAGDFGQSDLDPWEVLGVEMGASPQEIERAFRIKARSCHADRFPDDPEKKREWNQLQWAHAAVLEAQEG